MSRVQHLIALNTEDGSESLWKEMFDKEDSNFSEWVRLKLHEEKEKRMDKDYIYKKLAEAESQSAYWKKQLVKADEHLKAKEQIKNAEIKEDTETYNRKLEGTIMKIRLYKNESEEVLRPIAIQYLNIPEEQRTNIKDFLGGLN